jgi:MFS transporter, putative metabolite:H+ symporter
MLNFTEDRKLKFAIIVAALGYFVDIFDLTLFSILRVPSLRDLGLTDEQVLSDGLYLLNMQMSGLLVGGLIWGLLGDKLGRVQVLFGSILIYSLANLANAFVHDVNSYAILRFIAGVGLAGEVGAGITLVAELMPRERRGIATAFVATVGVAGAVAAALVAKFVDWRTAYIIGGIMGLALLVVRAGVHESGLFAKLTANKEVAKADLRLLFTRARFPRYLACILIGIPIWYFVGIVVTFSPEIGLALNMTAPLVVGSGIFYTYLGLTLGDMASGLLSQWLKSRRRAIAIFMGGAMVLSALALGLEGATPTHFYVLCLATGFCIGYWALMLTTATEQFGTNIRATVTSTVPNFVRGSTVLMTSAFAGLKDSLGVLQAAQVVGVVVFLLAFAALLLLRESFTTDLDFIEKD